MDEEKKEDSIRVYRQNAHKLLSLCDRGLISNRDYEEEKGDLEREYLKIRAQLPDKRIALLDQIHKEINEELYPPQGRNSLPPVKK